MLLNGVKYSCDFEETQVEIEIPELFKAGLAQAVFAQNTQIIVFSSLV